MRGIRMNTSEQLIKNIVDLDSEIQKREKDSDIVGLSIIHGLKLARMIITRGI